MTGGEAAPGGEAATPRYTIDRSKAGSAIPGYAFTDAAGKATTLARFAGKPILVNLWATWCAPCVAEMPQLDALAGAHAKDGIAVVAVSQDTMGRDRVVPFFDGKGFEHIILGLDAENAFGFGYGTGVLPTSVLYDAKGREVARITGALDWTGAEAKALVAQMLR